MFLPGKLTGICWDLDKKNLHIGSVRVLEVWSFVEIIPWKELRHFTQTTLTQTHWSLVRTQVGEHYTLVLGKWDLKRTLNHPTPLLAAFPIRNAEGQARSKAGSLFIVSSMANADPGGTRLMWELLLRNNCTNSNSSSNSSFSSPPRPLMFRQTPQRQTRLNRCPLARPLWEVKNS